MNTAAWWVLGLALYALGAFLGACVFAWRVPIEGEGDELTMFSAGILWPMALALVLVWLLFVALPQRTVSALQERRVTR